LEDKCHRETPDEESFPRIVEFYEIVGEILEAAEQKLYLSFLRERGFHSMTVRRSDKRILCDSFNIQNGKNYAMCSICEYYFHMRNNINIYRRSFSPMFRGEVILSV